MDLLIFLIVALVILALLGWMLTLIPMHQIFRPIIMVIAIVIVIVILLQRLGYL
jgi:hypothetical protein